MPRWKRNSVRISQKLTLVANLNNQRDHSQQALQNQQIEHWAPALRLMVRVAPWTLFQPVWQEANRRPHAKTTRLSRVLLAWENCSKATVNSQFRLLGTLLHLKNYFNRIWRSRLTCLIVNQKKRWIAFKLQSILHQTTILCRVVATSRSFKSSSLSVNLFKIANLGRLRACLTRFEHRIYKNKCRYFIPISYSKQWGLTVYTFCINVTIWTFYLLGCQRTTVHAFILFSDHWN